jgi:phage gpG-like protein
VANLKANITNAEIAAALQASNQLAKLSRPETLYKIWANYLERLAVQAYKGETAPFGSRWAPLKPATLSRKTRETILRDSSNMYDSTVGQVLPDGAQVGSNQRVGEYSLLAIHQFGAPRRGIPARRVLPMDDEGEMLPQAQEELIALARDWLES